MKMVRGLLFDKDGTLFDFGAMWLPAYRAGAEWVAAQRGDDTLAARLLESTGLDGDHFRPGSLLACGSTGQIVAAWSTLVGVDPASIAQPVTTIFERYSASHPVPITDLHALFGRLRGRGMHLGVATMDTTEGARSGLAALGLLDQVDMVIGSDAGHGDKPGPGMVRAFAARMDISPAEIIVVGDAVHDMEMARAAGARAVGVLSGTTPRDGLEGSADVILDSVADIEALL